MTTPTDDIRGGKPSASSISRVANCAGSPAAECGLPEEKEQTVTEEGSQIHNALFTGDTEELELTTREIAERLKSMEQEARGDWLDDLGDGKPVEEVRETRFWIRNRQTLEPLASAQPDVVWIQGDHAAAIDFKSGFKETEDSSTNWQLRCQALALWHEYPNLTHIRVAIAASRLTSKFDATDYALEDLQRAEKEFLHVIWRASQPDAPRVAGSWCRYCRARGQCSTAATYAMIASAGYPPESNALDVAQRVGSLTPWQLAFIHERKSLVVEILKAVEAKLKTLPEAELAAAGYKLAPGNNRTTITDTKEALKVIGDNALITQARLFEILTISRTKLIESVAETFSLTKKAATERVDELLAAAIEKKQGEPRLKPI